MTFRVVSPVSGELIEEVPAWDASQIEDALAQVADATPAWAQRPLAERCALLRSLGEVLRKRREEVAKLVTTEMGKLRREALAEVDKCVWACEFYAEQAPVFLADEYIASDAGKSYVAYQPWGTVLAVMPWNFPIWQVIRFAAPAVTAGNTALLKHASNVPRCALALESLFVEAGYPPGVFRTLMIRAGAVGGVIADPRVHAVTLTGSENAGREVAAVAGRHLKKSVLELGGSDAFIVLDDADLDFTVQQAVASRYLNAGQSCIAAKRFLVEEEIADRFIEAFSAAVETLKPGDPCDDATTLAPLARGDLRDELHAQVADTLATGGLAVAGCEPVDGPGYFYAPSIIDDVRPGMRAFDEELFGPVAAVVRVMGATEAVEIANSSRFGLGGSVWTSDLERGERLARELSCGAAFVNGMVKSDPRLPFGGVKDSGYGRELSRLGMLEFVNAKTIWVR